ncbi:MAG TPA: hypothetical protein DHN29_01255 [Cytophagales bacterium]|nr:hypothetical protein [Cytophagales bacterium]
MRVTRFLSEVARSNDPTLPDTEALALQDSTPAQTHSVEKFKQFINEIGATGTRIFSGIPDLYEYNADLKPPQLYDTIDRMRLGSAQVGAALLAMKLPVRGAPPFIQPASPDPLHVEQAKFAHAAFFNCEGTSFPEFLRQALLYLDYGHMVFEVVEDFTEDGKITWKKFAPRLPRTILEWHLNADDKIDHIVQLAPKVTDEHPTHVIGGEVIHEFTNTYMRIPIPGSRLLVFTNEMEGANYLGKSVLRTSYPNWFYLNSLYKVANIKHERFGAGIPIMGLPEGYNDEDLTTVITILEGIRYHEKGFVALPSGFTPGTWPVGFGNTGSTGLGTEDIMELIAHHNQMISASMLGHFLDLGRTKFGSRNLGETQVNIFLMALQSVADYVQDILTQAVKVLINKNWPDTDAYPKMKFGRIQTLNIDVMSKGLSRLVQVGAITPDTQLEAYIREIIKMPQKSIDAADEMESGSGADDEGGEEEMGVRTPPKKGTATNEGQTKVAASDIYEEGFLLTEHPGIYLNVTGRKSRGRRKRITTIPYARRA